MSRRPKFSRRDNYWLWHSFVVCIFDNKFQRLWIVISDDMPTYWALIDAFYDFWWFWPTAVYAARELYELTIGRFRILFYIVCGQFLHILWLKKTHAICHNGLFWSNPFFCQFRNIDQRCRPGWFFAHCAATDLPPYICTTNWQNAVRDLRRHGPHAVAGHTCTTYAKIVGRGHGNHIFWAFLLMIQHSICCHTCCEKFCVVLELKKRYQTCKRYCPSWWGRW